MLRFAADENFNGRIYRGLRRRRPDLDVVRVQDTELYGSPDPELLAWVASEGRLLLTHDVSTLTGFAIDRVRRGEAMPGVVEIAYDAPIGPAIEDVLILAIASEPEECEGQIFYLPL